MKTEKLNKDKIYETLDQHREALKKYGVERIGLFGSFLHGDNTESSDIDFLVDIEKGKKTLTNLVQLGDYLEGLFGRKVDIVTPQGLSPHIGPYILNEVQYAPRSS